MDSQRKFEMAKKSIRNQLRDAQGIMENQTKETGFFDQHYCVVLWLQHLLDRIEKLEGGEERD